MKEIILTVVLMLSLIAVVAETRNTAEKPGEPTENQMILDDGIPF